MRRVRFVVHVLGIPHDKTFYLKNEIAHVPDQALNSMRGSWYEDYSGGCHTCRDCQRDFAPESLFEHRAFYHPIGRYRSTVAVENSVQRNSAHAVGFDT